MESKYLYNEAIADRCVYGRDFVKSLLSNEFNYEEIFSMESNSTMSFRKVEGYRKIAKYRNYYQENPVQFIKDFFNIQLLDSQAYLFQSMWNKAQVLIVASRAYGKSFLIVLFNMAKQMLSSGALNTYIASGSSEQSATTFKKLEDIANDRIESLLNSTGSIFKAEVVIPNANGDGFSHDKSGFEYHLYNGSLTKSLNSNTDRQRGKKFINLYFYLCN